MSQFHYVGLLFVQIQGAMRSDSYGGVIWPV